MYALSSTEAVYRYAGIETQETLVRTMTHHWVFGALAAFAVAWRLLRCGFLLPMQTAATPIMRPPVHVGSGGPD